MRTLKEIRSFYSSILELKKDDETLTPGLQIKSADEKRFADKHVIKKIADRNGNGDDVFNATNVKGVDRQPKHGYNPGEDEKVYEEVEQADEGYVSLAQQRAVWASRKDGGKGHPDNKKKKVKEEVELDEMDKSQTPPGRGGENEYDPNGKTYYVKPIPSKKMEKDSLDVLKKAFSGIKKEEVDLDEGDVIQFPKRNKKNDEEDRKKPGWMLRQDPELAAKFKDAEERAKRRKKFREDEAKQFEEAAQLDPDKKAKQAIDTILKNHEEPAGEKGMPFEGPYTKIPKKQVGQKSDPAQSRVRHLARQAIVAKEDLEINEVLKPSMGVKAYIDDFVKSDDPRFKGASKKDRIKRALAAYYSAKRGD